MGGQYDEAQLTRVYSATPDVREFKLDRDNDQFMIVATDGLWDVMTSEEAVSVTARGWMVQEMLGW